MTEATQPTRTEYAAYGVSVIGALGVLGLHLLPALVAGLLVHELVTSIAPVFARRLSTKGSKGLAVGVLVGVVVAMVTVAVVWTLGLVKSEDASIPALLAKMAEIIEGSRSSLPEWAANWIPSSAAAVQEDATRWLREHASEIQLVGKKTGHTLAHILIGMVIGGMVSLREVTEHHAAAPLARALADRVHKLSEAFRRIVFAQVRISAINTLFTGLYLLVLLPILNAHLPVSKTLVLVTFIAGLMPVIGNLVSNTAIVVVSLAVSPVVAVGSLVFLVVIHKLEYFLNARIVGSTIRASAWELLTAMLIMESAFGVAGLVAAPIYYAWLKDELSTRGLV
ncbi:MAG: AI-2E family transporter [Deltaproteobacteria bacterium]|nr:AI-2E family transporter [Deltaproteobacteria bacterium]